MGAILTEGWRAQPQGLVQLRPEFAASASIVVVGGGNRNLAPVAAQSALITPTGVTRVAGPGGMGWRSDGTAALYRNVGKVAKFEGPRGLTLICFFSSTDTSKIQWSAGTLNTGNNFVEDIAFHRNFATGSYEAGQLSSQIRCDGVATPTVFSTVTATPFFDGKQHCLVVQWTVASPASRPAARMWVDGREQPVSENGAGSAFAQAAGLTEFDYYVNTRNLRDTPSNSLNGTINLFARLMSAQFDGKSLSANPWQMLEAPELDLYIPDAGGAYTLAADASSFTETGQAANLLAARIIAGATGSFTETGIDAGLIATRTIAGAAGSFTETGQDASLLTARTIAADAGAIALTGQDAALTYTPAGAYSLTAAAGSFTAAGQDAALLHATLMSAAAGAFAFTGNDASLVYTPAGSYSLTAAAGGFALTGIDAALSYSGVALNARARSAGRITETRTRPPASTRRRPSSRS